MYFYVLLSELRHYIDRIEAHRATTHESLLYGALTLTEKIVEVPCTLWPNYTLTLTPHLQCSTPVLIGSRISSGAHVRVWSTSWAFANLKIEIGSAYSDCW